MSILLQEMIVDADRKALLERADYERLVSEALSERPTRSSKLLSAMRRVTGDLLIDLGSKLQGPRPIESGFASQIA